jgi:hypothetical protein
LLTAAIADRFMVASNEKSPHGGPGNVVDALFFGGQN